MKAGARRKAKTQEERILAFFMSRPRELFTPDDVWTMFPVKDFGDDSRNTPLTSIRRAMTNLTTAGLLEKTKTMRIGYYGKLTHCWRIARPKHVHIQTPLFGGAT